MTGPNGRQTRRRATGTAGQVAAGLDPAALRRARGRVPGCVLSAGILAAPFVGLLYDVDLALGIAVVALAAAAWLAHDARSIAPDELRPRLRTVSVINTGLALLVLVLLVLRLTTR